MSLADRFAGLQKTIIKCTVLKRLGEGSSLFQRIGIRIAIVYAYQLLHNTTATVLQSF